MQVDGREPAGVERTPDVLARFRDGDHEAYRALFDRYLEPLTRFLRSHTDPAFRSAVPIEDLVQEIHLAALRAVDRFTYRRELSFYFWLCGIGRKLIANRCRALKRAPPAVHGPLLGGESGTTSADLLAVASSRERSVLDEICLKENLHLLALGLCRLPPRRREAIVLRYVDGHDNDHAAAILGMSVGAFRVLLSRALVELRDAFGEPLEAPA
jgi:RNA polymerase sigma factor (sigma-70 family)